MLFQTKLVGVALKAGPISTATALVAAVQISPAQDSGWTWIWRIALTLAAGIIGTLLTILFKNLQSWVRGNEKVQRDQHNEVMQLVRRNSEQQHRMIGVFSMLPLMVATAQKGGMSSEDVIRYVQEVQKVLER